VCRLEHEPMRQKEGPENKGGGSLGWNGERFGEPRQRPRDLWQISKLV